MNKSSSFLVHLHLLHFLIINKSPWTNLLKKFQKFNGKISRINLQGKISTNKSSKGKISKTIFQRKNLQWTNLHQNFQKLNGKISRINLQGKISMNKSSLKFFQKFNIHEQIFKKEKSPKPYSKGKISNEQIFQKEKSPFFKGKISKTIFQRKNLQNKSSRKNLHE